MPDQAITLSDDLFAELRKIDTPTITNVVATYPKNPLCLGLYNPWTENWYTDTSIRCIYPELGPIVGYAVTCVYGMPDPNYSGRLSFMDVVDALDAMKKPTILVIQQKWPDELMKKAGLAGEMMVSSMMAVGCVGLLSNGPSRDVDAIRKLKFQYLLGGVTAGHGEMAVQAVNVPVSVGGMDVAPGDLIHMDENGAVKFPVQHAEAVVKNAKAMLDDEARRLVQLRKAERRPRCAPPRPAAPTRRRRADPAACRAAMTSDAARPRPFRAGGQAFRHPDPAGRGRRPDHRRAGLCPRPRRARADDLQPAHRGARDQGPPGRDLLPQHPRRAAPARQLQDGGRRHARLPRGRRRARCRAGADEVRKQVVGWYETDYMPGVRRLLGEETPIDEFLPVGSAAVFPAVPVHRRQSLSRRSGASWSTMPAPAAPTTSCTRSTIR